MRSFRDICYSKEHGQCLDIHLPEVDTFPVFIYFHGGGIEAGDKADGPSVSEYVTSQGIAFISANYRMYPNAKYPDFLEDAAEAVAWVFKNISNYGVADGIYVGGGSAGGYISQMLCFDKRWLSMFGVSPMDVAGFILDAGQPTCHFNVLRERGIDTRRVIVDEAAPLYHVGEDKEYPPMLIIVSDNDMKNRLEQTELLVSTLKHFGHTDNVEFKMMHGKHCAYFYTHDENGANDFGKIVCEAIGKWTR